MGNIIDTKTLKKDIPNLIWIDKNVNNEENMSYKNYIIKEFKYNIFTFTSATQAIENLKKIEFFKTFIICSGKKYINFIKLFKETINEFMICPKIIIFTRNKNDYLERNKNDENLFLGHPFYNWGGVEDKFEEIIKFLKNEKKNKEVELENKANTLIVNIANLNENKLAEKIENLNENYIYNEENDENEIKLLAELENDENIKEKEKDKNQFPFENNNKEEQKLSFLLNNINNQEYLFPNIENAELNPFKDGDDAESIQLNFEYIATKAQLILPLFLSFYVRKPKEIDVRKFNHFMLANYSKVPKLVYLFDQLNLSYHIPYEVVSKYWVRAYTEETGFYKKMNKDLRLNKMNPYLPFIHMMYEGVKIKSFSYKPKNKLLYRGAKFDNKEILNLFKNLHNKNSTLPGCIVYCRSFFSFSSNLDVAMGFKTNALLIIKEFTDGIFSCPGCASIKKFSYKKEEEEILVFPFSCFEINDIKEAKDKKKNKNYYKIYLNYLGKYEKLFKGMEPEDLVEEIPEDSFLSQEVFKTNIVEKKYKDIFKRKKYFKHYYYHMNKNELLNFNENQFLDNYSIDENELYDNNNMDMNKLHKEYNNDFEKKLNGQKIKIYNNIENINCIL